MIISGIFYACDKAENPEEILSSSNIDHRNTEQNFWDWVMKIQEDFDYTSDGMIHHTGCGSETEAYNQVLNLISANINVFFELCVKFYERETQPEYTIVFKPNN